MTRRKPGEWWGRANDAPTDDADKQHPCPRCGIAMVQWVYVGQLVDYFCCADDACEPSLREQIADEL